MRLLKTTETVTLNTLVVGTGAAGYNAAIRLKKLGVDSVAIATEGKNIGTSRNTGSDKQTYYKLGLAGDKKDSVQDMAKDLFACGCMDGDNALVEAALSARCFLNLCELGVSFPTNRYGEFVGYKTDHDPCARATSVGPLTSKEMTECLEKEAQRLNITLYDNVVITNLIVRDGRVYGAVGVDLSGENVRKIRFICTNVIFATGGPGGIYRDSVYPVCHSGSSGVLFHAGAKGQNLTYWQFGLASVNPRWNVSGTYMQVLPRFVSVGEDGVEHEFLSEYFSSFGEMLSMVFLKGYQWPFDSRKVLSGSSVIDLLVYREKVMRNRRVYLDYLHNPGMKEDLDYSVLSPEAKEYLEKAGACFGTPIERLRKMNEPAIELYASKGLDISQEYLEVAVCAQHNNGGVKVDLWWQSTLSHLFVCGEAAGTHGLSRPGGSALNSGQVGSLRAAQYIAKKNTEAPTPVDAAAEENELTAFVENVMKNEDTVDRLLAEAQARMSAFGGILREENQLRQALKETDEAINTLNDRLGARGKDGLRKALRLRDLLYAQKMYLSAFLKYLTAGNKTSGSALYYDPNGSLREGLEEVFRFTLDDGSVNGTVQEMTFGDTCEAAYRPVRPLPEGGGFFENVWRTYRENGNIE